MTYRFVLRVAPIVLIAVAATNANASWLSQITGIDINVPAGTFRLSSPHPEAIPQALQQLPTDAATFFLNPSGPPLAFALRQAYAQARGSAEPMPDEMKALLSPYFPPVILNSALYTTRSRAGVSVPTVLEGGGQISAVTVDNLIIFTNDDDANDYGIWAHELTHVSQYRNLGIDGFAALYAGPGAVKLEDDAYGWQDHVVNDIRARGDNEGASRQWVDESGAGPPPAGAFTWTTFNAAARQVIPPDQCGQWAQVAPNAIQIANVCPAPLLVTFIDVNGMHNNCNGPICFFPPGENHVIVGVVGQINGIWFSFTN